MKKCYLNTIGLSILLFSLSCTTHVEQKVIHSVSISRELSATIQIPDYNDSLKIMQITDSHISIADEKEADLMKYGKRMHNSYMTPRKHYFQDTSKTTFEYLDDLLQQAKNENIELLILTGDIVNFPSAVSVKYVYDRLIETGIPWLYISGNHDWHYEAMDGSPDSLRKTWIEKSLLPFYNGHHPLFYSEIIKGINFVGIDNSTKQVNNQQLEFLKEQIKRKEPIVLISHIPYKYNSETEPPEMIAFIDLISSNSDKIVAILTGHNHTSSFYFTGNLCQYSSLAACNGASLVVNVKPD